MYAHPVKKMIGLLFLYTIIILGIFVLQFKSESVFSKALGALRFSVIQTHNEEQQIILKNNLSVSFRGINFIINKDNPAVITKSQDALEENITLISYKEASPRNVSFVFSDGSELAFLISDETPNATLLIQAALAADTEKLSIKYKPDTGISVSQKDDNSVFVETKTKKFMMSSSSTTNAIITFSKTNPLLSYTEVSETKGFTLDKAAAFALADENLYMQNIRKLSSTIVENFQATVQNDSLLTEQSVIAYVAIMGQNGQYNTAIDYIPDSFKKGQKRTYLSAPYFNTLSRMNTTLTAYTQNTAVMISNAVKNNNLDVFGQNNLADYLCQHPTSLDVKKLVSIPSTQENAFTLLQAVGIINTYIQLIQANSPLAQPLAPVIANCLTPIINACTIDNERIKLMDTNGIEITPILALETGDVLIRYGHIVSDPQYTQCGYLIINSYLSNVNTYDLYTLSEMYPLVVRNNSYYPHCQIIHTDDTNTIWAWTCARNIAYSESTAGIINLSIDFPAGSTHYLIINGIQPFSRIQIYDMDFRTDYRFESYNSSGYIYQSNTTSLLLKSRHKARIENIRLFPEKTKATEPKESAALPRQLTTIQQTVEQ